jgi:hypothetical protein
MSDRTPRATRRLTAICHTLVRKFSYERCDAVRKTGPQANRQFTPRNRTRSGGRSPGRTEKTEDGHTTKPVVARMATSDQHSAHLRDPRVP